MTLAMSTSPFELQQTKPRQRFLLWVDGVGGYLMCLGDRVTIGGPADADNQADVALLANLSRRHATFVRSGEGYVLEPHAAVFVGNRTASETTPLANGYSLRLGNNVELTFRLPSVLSATAVLDFRSDHRPVYSVDGVIMMEENCLLGPGRDQHIICPGWSESIVLYRREEQFWCKSRNPVSVAGQPAPAGGPIHPGDVVSSGAEVRFRIEEVN